MKKSWNYHRCINILSQEIALLQKIYNVQLTVRQAVTEQEWADFEWKNAEIKQLGIEFNELDNERVLLFTALAESTGALKNNAALPAFYSMVAKLPEEEKLELSRLYRAIKLETLRMKALSESFVNYLNEARNAASAYLEAAFPCRGGKLYTRKGAQTAQDLKSMMFNHHI